MTHGHLGKTLAFIETASLLESNSNLGERVCLRLLDISSFLGEKKVNDCKRFFLF